MKSFPQSTRAPGFTLLEIVIAMGLLTIIIGMVFGIARTSLALGNTIVETQNEEMAHQAFFDLLSRQFSGLPGNALLDLKVEGSGSHYLSELTLQNVPMSFTWGGQELIAKAVQLSTVRRRSGFLDIVLSYYEEEILDDPEATFGAAANVQPFAEIVLLEDVAYFEWRALDGRTLEWLFDWDARNRIPLQMELLMKIGAQGEEIRQVFWLPPKQHPGVQIRGMMQGVGAGGPAAPATGDGQDGGIEIQVPGPGGQPPGGGRSRGGGRPSGGAPSPDLPGAIPPGTDG